MTVSRHSAIRYIQRVLGMGEDYKPSEKEIEYAKKAVAETIGYAPVVSCTLVVAGFRYVCENRTVITVKAPRDANPSLKGGRYKRKKLSSVRDA